MLLFVNMAALALLVLSLFYGDQLLAGVKWLLDTIRTLVLGGSFGIAMLILFWVDIMAVVVTILVSLLVLFLNALIGMILWGITRSERQYKASLKRSDNSTQHIFAVADKIESWTQTGLAHTGKGWKWLAPSARSAAVPFVWVKHKLWP